MKLHDKLVKDVYEAMQRHFMPTYWNQMPDSFYEAIIENVKEASAYQIGYWSQDDISLAFQRVIVSKFQCD